MMFQSQEEIVKSVKWNGTDGVVELGFEGGMSWQGAERKDFFCPDEDWESRIKVGTKLRLWSLQFSRVAGLQIFQENKWITVWYVDNHFQTKQERHDAEAGYENCVRAAAADFVWKIEDGMSIKQAWEATIAKDCYGGLTGFQAGCIVNIAFQRSKRGEEIREWWNAQHGVHSKCGIVNPALLTLQNKN